MNDNQPLIQGDRNKIYRIVGEMNVIKDNKQNNNFYNNKQIVLTIGWQNINSNGKLENGHGINHLNKHFVDIPRKYHIYNSNNKLDKIETICRFVFNFLNNAEKHKKKAEVFYEESYDKPFIIRTDLGKLVLRYLADQDKYVVLTFYKSTKAKNQTLDGQNFSLKDFKWYCKINNLTYNEDVFQRADGKK